MEEEFDDDPILGVFVLIKDSITDEAVILSHSDSHHELMEELEEILEEENKIRKEENNRPNTLMESKHPKERYYYSMFKEIETTKDKEIIKYGDERTIYRIEEL